MHRLLPAILALAACSDPPTRSYVLVHGAFLGASGWTTVADELRAEGHDVRALDLPAHGADTTPVAEATLAGYIDRVAHEIDEAGGDVILVGHSMGGLVISGAAAQRAGRLRAAVYVGAYLPTDGQSLVALAMTDGGSQLGPHLQFHADGTVDVETAAFAGLFCPECDVTQAATLTAGYRAEPAGPLQEPVALTDAFAGVRRTYVHTTGDRVVSPELQAAMVAATPVAREVSIDTGHVPFISAPHDLVEILLAE